MTKNVTLRMDEELLKRLRHRAVDEHMSLSAWVIAVLRQTTEADDRRATARRDALRRLNTGQDYGGLRVVNPLA